MTGTLQQSSLRRLACWTARQDEAEMDQKNTQSRAWSESPGGRQSRVAILLFRTHRPSRWQTRDGPKEILEGEHRPQRPLLREDTESGWATTAVSVQGTPDHHPSLTSEGRMLPNNRKLISFTLGRVKTDTLKLVLGELKWPDYLFLPHDIPFLFSTEAARS